MQIGCGVSVKTIRGHEYLYVWHYESRDGRRRPAFEYIGPAANADSRRRAADVLDGHARKALDEARRWLQAARTGAMAAAR